MTVATKIAAAGAIAAGLALGTLHELRAPVRAPAGEHIVASRSPLMPVAPWAAQDAARTEYRKHHSHVHEPQP